MDLKEIERDLGIIRATMEASSRYTNIPATASIVAGLAGLAASAASWLILSPHSRHELSRIGTGELVPLFIVWTLTFLVAGGGAIVLSRMQAIRLGIPAWNSLASRMFLSQVPLIVVAGVLTVAAGFRGYVDLVPGIWLCGYGLVLHAISFYTGTLHRWESRVFMLCGFIALFSSGGSAIVLLGFCFGLVHLTDGCVRFHRGRQHDHDSGQAE